MNNYVKLVLGIAIAASIFSAGWVIRGWKENSVKLAIEQATKESRDASANAAAEAIAKIPQLTTKIYTGTSKTQTYVTCTHSDEVWQTIGEAFK